MAKEKKEKAAAKVAKPEKAPAPVPAAAPAGAAADAPSQAEAAKPAVEAARPSKEQRYVMTTTVKNGGVHFAEGAVLTAAELGAERLKLFLEHGFIAKA